MPSSFTVTQPQKNLFFSYRGALPTGERPEEAFDRQLEDNATKALVYVLENTDRKLVLQRFLQEVVGLRRVLDPHQVRFALQRVDIGRPTIHQRVALGIAPLRGLKRGGRDSHRTGRPDAWIWCENAFAILVETKVRDRVTQEQVQRHIASAEGWRTGNTRVASRAWADVYDFFLRVHRQHPELDAVSNTLIDEILRYIRMIGLASSTTFDVDDFTFFMLRPDDRHGTLRELLKRKLLRFTEDLSRSPAMRRVIKRYAGSGVRPADLINPGVLRRDSTSFWITIGEKQRRDHCHFTIRIEERGISLEVFSPHRSFTRGLVRKIHNRPAAFVASLKAIGRKAPYLFRLREAYYHDPLSSYKGQRIAEKVDFLEVHPRIITAGNVEELIVQPIKARLSEPNRRPEAFLVRDFRLSELVGNSEVVSMVSSAAEPMLDYLEFALAKS